MTKIDFCGSLRKFFGSTHGSVVYILTTLFSFIILPGLHFTNSAEVPALQASAQTCDRQGCGIATGCFSPAIPAPQALWDKLQPTDPSPLPHDRDTTDFNEFTTSYWTRNWFEGVEVQNGFVIAGLAHGIGVWDARTNPGNPTLLSTKLYGPGLPFPFIPGGENSKIPFGGVATPEGVDTVAAVTGYNGSGLLVFDLSNKSNPRPTYQRTGLASSDSVYIATIGGVYYAFQPAGSVYIYNLSKAVTLNGCLDDGSGTSCPDVQVGKITPGTGNSFFIHGVDNYIVVSSSGGGFYIYDISNPVSPQLKMSATLNGRYTFGVAMWKQGGKYYVASRLGNTATLPKQTAIYDVSCITTDSCSAPTTLWTQSLNSSGGADYISFSRSGTRPFIYLGSDASCGIPDGLQREWLFDVSNPAVPVDVSPQKTIPATAMYSGTPMTINVNYWSYYYRANPTGFYLVAPRAGKFNGSYFYRAGRSILDVHKLVDSTAPVAEFTWTPQQIYPGTAVQFTDQSSGNPTSWSWTFQGASMSSSTSQNPTLSFANPGQYTVSLTSANQFGASQTVSHTVTVLDPAPHIGSISISPANPLQCQTVTLMANSVTGKPPLTYSWTIRNSGESVAPGGTSGSNPFIWDTKANAVPAGQYTATVQVSGTGSPASLQTTFTVGAQPSIPMTFTPTTDTITGLTVQFHVVAAGAAEWNWNFGDNPGGGPDHDGYSGWTSDQVSGPNPSHTYGSAGQYTVKVKVRNCVSNQNGAVSTPIEINATVPLFPHRCSRTAIYERAPLVVGWSA